MCIIAIQTIGSKISDERIRQMYNGNPDGAGIMWADNGVVRWRKGFFSVERLLDAWHRIPEGVTAAVHCRITTHGGTVDRLCHPFPLTNKQNRIYKLKGKAKCVLMHNGIMHFMESDGHYGKLDSDSSAYAKKLYDMLGGARLPNTDEEMESIRKETSGSRILLMDGSGKFFTAGEWTWEDGVLYSNTTYKWKTYSYGSNYKSSYGSNYSYGSLYDYGYSSKKNDKKDDKKKTDTPWYGGIHHWEDDEWDDIPTYGTSFNSKLFKDEEVDEKELIKEKHKDKNGVEWTADEIEELAYASDLEYADDYGFPKYTTTGQDAYGNYWIDKDFVVYRFDRNKCDFVEAKDIYLEEYNYDTDDWAKIAMHASGAK